jgi:hypothetical protein
MAVDNEGDYMTSGKRLAVALGIGAIVILGSLSTAHAQYAAPPSYFGPGPSRGMYRSGLVLGFGLGVGSITTDDNCVNCGGAAGGLEFHIGGMLNPRMAVLFEAWGLARDVDGGGTLTNSIGMGALQFWVNDVFWLKGGLGFGSVRFSYYGTTDTQSGLGLSAAGGFEVLQYPGFALDLQLRVAHMSYDFGGATNFAFMVGFNWY